MINEETCTTSRGSILQRAVGIINGERQDQYGDPEDSFKAIAEVWTWYLQNEVYLQRHMAEGANISLNARDVALMMVLFKLARQCHQHKADNLIDAAGYLGILGDMGGRK